MTAIKGESKWNKVMQLRQGCFGPTAITRRDHICAGNEHGRVEQAEDFVEDQH